jgi:hypothetical protein
MRSEPPLERSDRSPAAHPRHQELEHDHLRALGFRLLDQFGPGAGPQRTVAAALEQRHGELERRGIGVAYEHG